MRATAQCLFAAVLVALPSFALARLSAPVEARRLANATDPHAESSASSGQQDWQSDVLQRHNKYRCMHGAPPLVWSEDIEANAKQWAVAGRGQRSPPYRLQNLAGFAVLGENIAMEVTDPSGAHSPAGAVQLWYDEVSRTPGERGVVDGPGSGDWSRYTQLVWKSSSTVGCAYYGTFFVCQYGPAGNEPGKYAEEVGREVRTYQEC